MLEEGSTHMATSYTPIIEFFLLMREDSTHIAKYYNIIIEDYYYML